MRGEPETIMNVQLESYWPSNAATCSRAATRGKAWTYQEIKTLKKSAGKLPVEDIAKLLGRTRQSVQIKAGKLGLSLRLYGQLHHSAKFSDSAVEYARRLYDKGWKVEAIAQKYQWPLGVVKTWCYFQRRTNDPVVLQ